MKPVTFLERSAIDNQQWDRVVENSACSQPYAFTWYLDIVAEHWDALVSGDYEYIMPLVWLRKLGIKCMYQPYYCQQLGVFGEGILNREELNLFLKVAVKRFPYINTNFNPSAAAMEGAAGVSAKKNLLLSLQGDYQQLKKNYTVNHKRNIAKAEKNGLHLMDNCELKDFQKFYLGNIDPEKEKFKSRHTKIFKDLTSAILSKKTGEIVVVAAKDEAPEAAMMLLYHKNKIINIINTSSAEGKRSGASHLLFDKVIQQYAGSGRILDFEGSSVPGVARFYEGFGPTREVFYNYRYSLLKNPGIGFSLNS